MYNFHLFCINQRYLICMEREKKIHRLVKSLNWIQIHSNRTHFGSAKQWNVELAREKGERMGPKKETIDKINEGCEFQAIIRMCEPKSEREKKTNQIDRKALRRCSFGWCFSCYLPVLPFHLDVCYFVTSLFVIRCIWLSRFVFNIWHLLYFHLYSQFFRVFFSLLAVVCVCVTFFDILLLD